MASLHNAVTILRTGVGCIAIFAVASLGAWDPPADKGRLSAADWKRPLEEATAGADRLEVAPILREKQPPEFVIRGERNIRELIKLIEIDASKSKGICNCYGDSSFQFYKGDKLLVSMAFAHGSSLKWSGWPRRADAVLTEQCRVKLTQWFKKKGYAAFETERLEEMVAGKLQRLEDLWFASFFPAEVRELVLAHPSTDDKADKRIGQQVAEMMSDPKAVAIAASRALGISRYGMSASTEKERRALAAAATVNDEAFLSALREMAEDENGLRGAARLFFCEEQGASFPPDVRAEWAVRLAEVVFTRGFDEDKPTVLMWFWGFDDPRVRTLLHKVAAGEIGTEIKLEKAFGQEPGLRTGAMLSLAMLGDKTIKPDVEAMMSSVRAKENRAALEVCLALGGDPAYIKKEHFSLESYNIGLAAVMAIEQFHGTEGMDVLVEGGFSHPWAGVNDEALEAFQRITKQSFEDKVQYTYPPDNAQRWWKEHREEWLREHPSQHAP